MPAVSEKQKRFMQAVAHNKGFAKKAGVPQSVGREFSKAQGGGVMKESKAMMKKEIAFMQKKGAPKSMIKHEKAEAKYAKGGGVYRRAADGIAQRGKTKGKMLRKGGKVC
jgi:hypothetical protein